MQNRIVPCVVSEFQASRGLGLAVGCAQFGVNERPVINEWTQRRDTSDAVARRTSNVPINRN